MTQVPDIYSMPEEVGQQGSPLTRALVVNVQDPEQTGRVQIRIVGHHDDEQQIPDNKLPWVRVMNGTTTPSLQGSSTSHGLMPGAMVAVQAYGEQDWMITGSLPNDRRDSEQAVHPAVHGKGNTDSIWGASKNSKIQKGDGTFGWPKPLEEIFNNKTTAGAKALREQAGRKGNRTKSDPIEEAQKHSPTPSHYGFRAMGKDLQGGSIASTMFPGAQNAQKFIQQTIQNKSAVIPSALAALETLKKVKGNPTSIDSIGAGNFAGMLQQLAALFKKSGGNENEQRKLDCDELKKLPDYAMTDEMRESLRICLLIEERILEQKDTPTS